MKKNKKFSSSFECSNREMNSSKHEVAAITIDRFDFQSSSSISKLPMVPPRCDHERTFPSIYTYVSYVDIPASNMYFITAKERGRKRERENYILYRAYIGIQSTRARCTYDENRLYWDLKCEDAPAHFRPIIISTTIFIFLFACSCADRPISVQVQGLIL